MKPTPTSSSAWQRTRSSRRPCRSHRSSCRGNRRRRCASEYTAAIKFVIEETIFQCTMKETVACRRVHLVSQSEISKTDVNPANQTEDLQSGSKFLK